MFSRSVHAPLLATSRTPGSASTGCADELRRARARNRSAPGRLDPNRSGRPLDVVADRVARVVVAVPHGDVPHDGERARQIAAARGLVVAGEVQVRERPRRHARAARIVDERGDAPVRLHHGEDPVEVAGFAVEACEVREPREQARRRTLPPPERGWPRPVYPRAARQEWQRAQDAEQCVPRGDVRRGVRVERQYEVEDHLRARRASEGDERCFPAGQELASPATNPPAATSPNAQRVTTDHGSGRPAPSSSGKRSNRSPSPGFIRAHAPSACRHVTRTNAAAAIAAGRSGPRTWPSVRTDTRSPR